LGLVGIYFFLIFFNIGGEFLVNVAGFVIPSYYSLNALFSAAKVDDTQVSVPVENHFQRIIALSG
jgi:receptor expression-enhancing protein 5/6